MEENGLEMNGNGEDTHMEEREEVKCLSSYVDTDKANDIHKYYLSRRTALEMLRDRGYTVPSSEIDISFQQFKDVYGLEPDVDRLKFSAVHSSDPSKSMLIIFGGPGVLKVGTIRLIFSQIVNKDSLTGVILILQNQITNQALKAVDIFKFTVEMFQITDLLINITKHVLKPKHYVLTDQEKKKLLKDYCIEEKQLPRLLRKDAIARYYGLQKGQVVKVTYSGDITESHVTYRVVW